MECDTNDRKDDDQVLGRIGQHVLRAGHFALFGEIEAAEIEMQQAIDLLKSTEL